MECLCICGLFDFPRGVEFDEMGAEVEQPNSNAERIVVASSRIGIPLPRQKSGRPRTSAQNEDSNWDAALRPTVAAKTRGWPVQSLFKALNGKIGAVTRGTRPLTKKPGLGRPGFASWRFDAARGRAGKSRAGHLNGCPTNRFQIPKKKPSSRDRTGLLAPDGADAGSQPRGGG